jgi:hypothetical protein
MFLNGEEIFLDDTEINFSKDKCFAKINKRLTLRLDINELKATALDDRGKKANVRHKLVYEKDIGVGEFYALLIAIQDYPHPSLNSLDYPIQDALRFKSVLIELYSFPLENINFLKNPDRATIIRKFVDLRKRITDEDNLLIFYAGHGYWDKEISQGYWITSKASKEDRVEWISNGTVRDYVTGIKSKHTLVISDACFSGGIFKTRNIDEIKTIPIPELYKLKSRKAMTSGNMKAVPDRSVFLEYLVKILEQNKNKYISAGQLYTDLREPVSEISPTKQMPQYRVIPGAEDKGGDFIFFRKR